MVSLHDIHSPSTETTEGAASADPLTAVLATNASSEAQGLVDQLKQEEAALQQRLAEIDAQQQYEQVRLQSHSHLTL